MPATRKWTELHLQCLRMIAEGKSNPEIGRELYLAPDTVKGYITTICRRLGAKNRVNAVHRAWELGLLKPEDGGGDEQFVCEAAVPDAAGRVQGVSGCSPHLPGVAGPAVPMRSVQVRRREEGVALGPSPTETD